MEIGNVGHSGSWSKLSQFTAASQFSSPNLCFATGSCVLYYQSTGMDTSAARASLLSLFSVTLGRCARVTAFIESLMILAFTDRCVLQGEEGETGPKGFAGPRGLRGADAVQQVVVATEEYRGLQGRTGQKGFRGDDGEEGLVGIAGQNGAAGRKGIQGQMVSRKAVAFQIVSLNNCCPK